MSQSQRKIPVHASVDIVVVGGTTAGVAAAEAAARSGASVFVAAPRLYLGEDICGTLRMEPGERRVLATDLEKALFPRGGVHTPLHVKGVLTKSLVDAGVQFLFASYATELLRDAAGRPAGVVIANRAGRQAIVAKVVIDATEQAWVCRMAGCQTTPWSGGAVTFEQGSLMMDGAPPASSRTPPAYRARVDSLDIEIPDLSFLSLNKARDVARDRTCSEEMLRQAETLFFVPPANVVCRRSQREWAEGGSVDVGHFRPAGAERLYVLSGWADVPRAKAAELLRPAALCATGVAVGRAAAAEAKSLAVPTGVRVPGGAAGSHVAGDVMENLRGARPTSEGLATILSEATGLPVLAEVDVLVVGGGTAGAPAAISAARRGAKTLVIEFQEGLGGVGTIGQIGSPYHGRNAGFAKEVPYPRNTEEKMEWYRRELYKAGGQIWLRTLGAGAFLDGKTVKGAVVCTMERRGVVLAKVVIDATGNGDVAISAGAEYMYGVIEQGDIAMQGAGFSKRIPGQSYNNSDYLFVDEADMIDVWSSLGGVYLRPHEQAGRGATRKEDTSHDYSTHILTRERRRVVGDVVIRYVDQIAGRTYGDAIVLSESNYDSHGYPTGPFFYLFPHDEKSLKEKHPAPGGACYSSYRAFTPKGLEGILVAGLGISMDRDVTAMIRMQRDISSQGYALGVAAAMAAEQGIPPRRIDVKVLQKHLVEIGALPEEALWWTDNFPLPKAAVEEAVVAFGKSTEPKGAGQPLAVILTHREAAMPLLRNAYEKAEGRAKLLYARILAVFGDKRVAPFLVAELNKVREWDAKILQGVMADHAHLPTPVDSLVLALGCAGDRATTPALVRMIGLLRDRKGTATLSHYRALALAAERLGDPALAQPLASLLVGKSGQKSVAAIVDPNTPETASRSRSIQEICLARALYRIGDHEGLGKKVLETYRNDKRGLFARHAAAVLAEKR